MDKTFLKKKVMGGAAKNRRAKKNKTTASRPRMKKLFVEVGYGNLIKM